MKIKTRSGTAGQRGGQAFSKKQIEVRYLIVFIMLLIFRHKECMAALFLFSAAFFPLLISTRT